MSVTTRYLTPGSSGHLCHECGGERRLYAEPGFLPVLINTFKEGLSDGLSLTGVVKHNWNRMNTWSRVATVGMAGLAGYYAYAQVRSMYLSLKNLFGSMFGTTTNTDTQDPSVAAGLAA